MQIPHAQVVVLDLKKPQKTSKKLKKTMSWLVFVGILRRQTTCKNLCFLLKHEPDYYRKLQFENVIKRNIRHKKKSLPIPEAPSFCCVLKPCNRASGKKGVMIESTPK
jgi:hypothetical protein